MINWFARNGVAANLLVAVVAVGGLASLANVKVELFPSFSLDSIIVRVPYLGAAPEEVEEGVILLIEEAIQGLDGIKEIRSSAQENYGTVTVEAVKGANLGRLKDEIEARVDAIPNFPEQIERPIIEELIFERDVIWVSVYGDAGERDLKEMAQRVRDELVELPGISQARVQGVRGYEISIEVSELALRRYGLTFDEVVQAVQRGSQDIPGGLLKTRGGEILLRTKEKAYRGEEFAEKVLITRPDGTRIRVGEVATVVDGFTDEPILTSFNGKPSALVLVREVGRESPLDISAKVTAYVEQAQKTWLPKGIGLATWGDSSFYLRGRLEMLINNGAIGFVLVLLTLSLFLRPSVAFFVAIGIPLSFLGTFMVAPVLGLSINLVSLFAFILVLGIVVDDAIVVGESVFSEFQARGPGVESAVRGTHLVSTAVTFSVLTTMVAFVPVLLLPGQVGKFFSAIPLVVIPTLFFSLVQSKLQLPYHLSLCKVGDGRNRGKLGLIGRVQRVFADGLEAFVGRVYVPILRACVARRYLTTAAFIAVFIFSIGMVAGGWVRFVQFPSVPSDFIQMELRMPEGTPLEETERAMERITTALAEIRTADVAAGKVDPVKHTVEFIGFGQGASGSNRGFILAELAKSEVRDSNALEVGEEWRKMVGDIPGARRLTFQATAGPPTGFPIDVRLTGRDFGKLQEAAGFLRERLASYEGLFDIRDTFSEGKKEIKLRVKPQAEVLGLTASDLGRQVRAAFYGAEAQRLQRGRDDIRVMVRYPKSERVSLGSLEAMRIRTPDGREVPISEVADLEIGEGYPMISRIDRQRVINVQADADKQVADLNEIAKDIYGRGPGKPSILKEIGEKYPGVSLVKSGEAKDWEETQSGLLGGVVLVAVCIYALLAVPFKSYLQPFIVMSVIPFGIAGAIFGHLVTGQNISMLSMLGIIALSGVVVNDSLVMVDFVNQRRRGGVHQEEAILEAGPRRFRAILLTSLTTFMGLVPILLERTLQAQFLIPMATSLGFGVMFATAITLLLVPCLYLILEDFRHAVGLARPAGTSGLPPEEVPAGAGVS